MRNIYFIHWYIGTWYIEKRKCTHSCSDHLQFACCGINGSSNYGTSWWRLQEVGRRELVVPLSCCTLNNANETNSFLNPKPANLTLCQTLNPAEHQYARHTAVCTIMRKLLPPCHAAPRKRMLDELSESVRIKDQTRMSAYQRGTNYVFSVEYRHIRDICTKLYDAVLASREWRGV